LDQANFDICNYTPCSSLNLCSTVGERIIIDSRGRYIVRNAIVSHFREPVSYSHDITLDPNSIVNLSANPLIENWISRIDYTIASDNSRIDVNVDLDETEILRMVKSLPIHPEFPNQTLRLNLNINVDISYMCNGEIVSHQYVITKTLEYHITDLFDVFTPKVKASILNKNNKSRISISDLGVFPNPANDIINIRFEHMDKNTRAEIFNSNGIRVHSSFVYSGLSNIDITDLSPGIYFVKVDDDIERFIKK